MGLRWSRCAGWTHSVETAISGALFLGHAPPNGSRGAGKVETAIPMALYLGPDPDIDLAEVVKFHQPSQRLCACDPTERTVKAAVLADFTSHLKGFVLETKRICVVHHGVSPAIAGASCLRHDELRFQGFRACFTSHRRGFVLATRAQKAITRALCLRQDCGGFNALPTLHHQPRPRGHRYAASGPS